MSDSTAVEDCVVVCQRQNSTYVDNIRTLTQINRQQWHDARRVLGSMIRGNAQRMHDVNALTATPQPVYLVTCSAFNSTVLIPCMMDEALTIMDEALAIIKTPDQYDCVVVDHHTKIHVVRKKKNN